jgi:hypothetical protein
MCEENEMSSELIEDVEDDRGTAIFMSMNVHCHAVLAVVEGPERWGEFRFAPDANGLALAEKVEAGLREWRRHVQEINSIMEEV